MDNSYDLTRLFKFNLISPKTREELEVLEERDNTILYSFVLIFSAVLVFFLLTLMKIILVDPKLNYSEQNLTQDDSTINSFASIKASNGQLFLKAKSLESILVNDIKISELLKIGDQIVKLVPGIQVQDYSRESNGDFVLSFQGNSFDQAQQLIKAFKQQVNVQNTFLRSVFKNKDTATIIISFNLTNNGSQTATKQ